MFEMLRSTKRQAEQSGAFAEFCRMTLAQALATKSGLPVTVEAEKLGCTDRVRNVLKTAVNAGTTSGDLRQLTDFAFLDAAFTTAMRTESVFAAMAPDMVRVPAHARVAFNSHLMTTVGNTLEGAAKPARRWQFGETTTNPVKAAAMIVLTAELLLQPAGRQ